MGSKILYIDNVTSDRYIKEYADSHSNNNSFTYVTFSEYSKKAADAYCMHGDIFFNGNKITYYNDINSAYVVTDGFDNFVGYVNDEGCISVAYIGIRINDNNVSTNRYDLFNITTIPNNITYELVSEIEPYVNISGGEWKIYGDEHINVSDTISGNVDDNISYHVVLSYVFNIENNEYTSYAYFNVNNVGKIENLSIKDFPNKLAYNTIFTPYIDIIPESAKQNSLHWHSDSDAVTILNTQTGTFRCNKPESSVQLTCSYNDNNDSTNVSFEILKVNPMLSISAYGTTYLWANEYNEEYNTTVCYAHYDSRDLNINGYEWRINNASIDATPTRMGKIYFEDINANLNIVKFILPEAYFYPNSAVIQLYAMNYAPEQTTQLNIVPAPNNPINTDYNTVNLVISATSANGGVVDTNYTFETHGSLTNFTITDIQYDQASGYTYTYVTAEMTPNLINDIYASNSIDSSETILNNIAYTKISVSTSDYSFISATNADISVRDIEELKNLNKI